ncbi:MAG: HEAT repeat domain-containing protein, partial [Actinomycetota bacterium]
TLFFVRFGVESLPVMILISGPVLMVTTLIYAGGLGRLGSRRWLAPALAAMAGLLVIERVAVTFDVPTVYAVVWLGAQAAILVSYTVMWNAASDCCDTRQAKRLFPLFAAAGIFGGVIGNATTGPLASSLGTENLLVVQAVLFITASLLTARAIRRFARPSGPPALSAIEDLRSGLALTKTSPLLRLVAFTALAFSVLFFLVSFPFSEVVTASFGTEEAVAGYLGTFSAVATALTFLVSLLGTNRLFSRIGVVATLAILPLAYLAGFGLWLAAFGLFTASLVRGVQWIAVNALGGTAWTALFNVLPGRRRGQVMAFMSGIPTQLGTMVSGVLLLAGSVLAPGIRTAIGLAIAAITVALVLRMRHTYTSALVGAVREGTVELFSTPLPGLSGQILGPDTLSVLSQVLVEDEPHARAVAAGLLGQLRSEQAAPLVAAALSDPEPAVRVAALGAIADDTSSLAHVKNLLGDFSPEVRRAAVKVLSRHQFQLEAEFSLTDPDPTVRAFAATLVPPPAGRPVLEAMMASDDPNDLTAALEVAARMPSLIEADLGQFATHRDRRVREAAALALAGRPSAVEALRGLLDDPSVRVRSAAAKALASDTDSVGALGQTLADGSVRASEAALYALSAARDQEFPFGTWISGEVERARYLQTHRLALGNSAARPSCDYLRRLLLMRQRRLERWALEAMRVPE